MSINNDTLRVLGILDPNIDASRVFEDHYTVRGQARVRMVIEAVLTYPVTRCSHCGFEALRPNGRVLVHVRVQSATDMPVVLNLKKQRWYCGNCHQTMMATSPVIQANYSISAATREYVVKLAHESLTMTLIAKQTGISVSSVQRIIKQELKTRNTYELPSDLCFDEFRSTHKQMAFICIDAKSHRLITMLGDRYSKSIKNYFTNQFDTKQRALVKTVTIDMNATYQNFIHELFPNAKIIVDRFHIVQLVGRALDQVRINCLKQIDDKRSRVYKVAKTNWRLFHKANPDATKVKYLFGLNEYMTEQNAIDIAIDQFPDLKAAYETYIDVHEALMSHNPELLKTVLSSYKRAGNAMDTAITTLRKYQTSILAATTSPFSNGPLEGINRKIKALKRGSYGFANQENMFLRIWNIIA